MIANGTSEYAEARGRVTLAEVFRPRQDGGLQSGLDFMPLLEERVAQ